jgi:hypothetical protein
MGMPVINLDRPYQPAPYEYLCAIISCGIQPGNTDEETRAKIMDRRWQEAIDEAVRRVFSPSYARSILEDVDDGKIGFENFPITILEVGAEYREIMASGV